MTTVAPSNAAARTTFPSGVPPWLTLIAWLFAILFPLIAISQQSFWIDEAITGNAARQSSLANWWHSLVTVNGSDLQMPFYMLYVWAWEKVFGSSEISLRLANYPWFLLGQVAVGAMWADRGKSLLFIVAAACNAFLWFYLDEARPYIMQYGVSCGTGYLLISFQRSKRVPLRNYWLFSLALIVLAGASMLGAAWSATAILVMSVILLRKRTRPPLLPLIVCAGALGILGSYYLWTLTNGVFGSRLPTQLILNIFYVPYELCGFAGLGPGRLDIREAGLSSFRPFAWPLAAFAITWLMLIFYLLRAAAWKDEKSSTLIIFGFAIPPVLCLFLVGLFINFNILGRHVTPAMPFVLLVVTLGITLLLQKKRALPGVVAVVFALLSISSCFGIRFCPWHSKDNYRGAAAAVSELVQDRQVAWWCASWEAAEYYHLPVRQKPDERSASILVVRSPNAEQLRSLPAPDVVVLSKPDIYDSKGTIAAMLQQENFSQIQTFKAFAIWKRP